MTGSALRAGLQEAVDREYERRQVKPHDIVLMEMKDGTPFRISSTMHQKFGVYFAIIAIKYTEEGEAAFLLREKAIGVAYTSIGFRYKFLALPLMFLALPLVDNF